MSLQSENLKYDSYNPMNYSTDFNSYEELSEKILERINSMQKMMKEESILNNAFERYVNEMNLCRKIKVPKFYNDYLVLEEQHEYSVISLQAKDLYDVPWIFYHFPDSDFNSYIKYTLLDEETINIAEEKGILNLLDYIDPLPEDGLIYPPYSEISEKKIYINNTMTNVIVGRFKDDPRIYTTFIYDNMLVIVCCSEEKSNSDFFNNLSFGDMPLR